MHYYEKVVWFKLKPFTGFFNNLILLNSDTENGQRLGGTNIKRAKQCNVKKLLSLCLK